MFDIYLRCTLFSVLPVTISLPSLTQLSPECSASELPMTINQFYRLTQVLGEISRINHLGNLVATHTLPASGAL